MDFPSPPLASPRKRHLPSKMDWTGGAGGGICPAALLRLLLLLERPFQARPPLRAGWRAPALAHLGGDIRAPLGGMLASPPQRWEAVGGLWTFFLVPRPFAVLVEMCFSCPPARTHPDPGWVRYLSKARQIFRSGTNQALLIVISNKTALPPKGPAFCYPL